MSKYLDFLVGSSFAFVTCIFLFVYTFYSPVFGDANGNNVVTNNFPQGWAFFTKNPRDVRTQLLDSISKQDLIQPNFSIEYYFGLSRKPRRLCLEAGYLVKGIPDSLWIKSKNLGKERLRSSFKTSFFKHPILVGHIIIMNKERTPWAWSAYEDKLNFPTYYTSVISK